MSSFAVREPTGWALVNAAVRVSYRKAGGRVPQACACLLAAAREAGYEVGFRDYQLAHDDDPLRPEQFADFLDDGSNVVAISCMSSMLPLVLAGTEIFKQRHPDRKIVLGGIGPSGVAAPLMRAFPHVDVVAVGEGEETFRELLGSSVRGDISDVAGLMYRDDRGTLVATPPRVRMKALDDLPMPAYDLLDVRRYETVGVQTTRGCPFPCKFCDVSAYWGRKVSYRSIPHVFDELSCVQSYRFGHVEILDDTFVLDRRRVVEFCREYVRRGLSIRWSAYCRVDLLDNDLIDTFAESGCYRVFLGIESGSDRVLRQISKPFERDHLFHSVARMAKHYVVRCNLIWGFPFESVEDLDETLRLMKQLTELGCDVTLALLSPLPLSSLYEEKRYELVFHEEMQSSLVGSRFTLASGEFVERKNGRVLDLVRRHPEVFPGFYAFRDDLFQEKLARLTAFGIKNERLDRP